MPVVATRLLRCFVVPCVSLVLLGASRAAVVSQSVSDRTGLDNCEREVKKLSAPRWGEKIRYPARTDHVLPAYPPIPEGTRGGGVWIGEILIDAHGRVSKVWTIRQVRLTPAVPLLNKAITDAVVKWEFAPAAVDNVPVPVCRTVSVNVNLKAIRAGQ